MKTRRKNLDLCMFKILNELVEIPINDRLIPADRRTGGGHNQAYKHIRANTLNFEMLSSSTSYLEYEAGGGKGLVDLVNPLTLERCHSF